MKQVVMLAVLAAGACGNKSSSEHAGVGSGTGTGTGTGAGTGSAATPARGSFLMPRGEVADDHRVYPVHVWFDGTTVREFDRDALFDPDRAGSKVDDDGRITPRDPALPPPGKDFEHPPDAAIVVFADRTTRAAPLLDAMAKAFPLRCWGLAALRANKSIEVLAPSTCPGGPPRVAPGEDDQVQLAIWRHGAATTLAVSRINDISEVPDPSKLEAGLREQKNSAFFADRADAAVGFDDAATIGDVVELLATVHAAGFVGARWIAEKYLPVALGPGVGTDPEPRPPASAGEPDPAPAPAVDLDIACKARPGDPGADTVQRTIERRSDRLSACFARVERPYKVVVTDHGRIEDAAPDGLAACVDRELAEVSAGNTIVTCTITTPAAKDR